MNNFSAILTAAEMSCDKNVVAREMMERVRQRATAIVQRLWDNRDRLGLWHSGYTSLGQDALCSLLITYHIQIEITSYVF